MTVTNTYGRVRKLIGFNLFGSFSSIQGFERHEGQRRQHMKAIIRMFHIWMHRKQDEAAMDATCWSVYWGQKRFVGNLLKGQTVGVIGDGHIGSTYARMMPNSYYLNFKLKFLET
ncbi:hypothetical protein CIPAW_15G014900 [Carya illinoinensis]|uniref:D-isomer specific 2-hydroxyacid dehydrogenase NAD-binding domain-containing protein n=1 Tax=Carya illinoinensis TaxID=32201 RepID=A0A8T1NA81_CARIL|nr:hypothetical protein CIPAW_15G014900 [Carya illinoinensis]KAG6673910.1 hypothetical protein I3842_15G014500 [Carya illinoinensis]